RGFSGIIPSLRSPGYLKGICQVEAASVGDFFHFKPSVECRLLAPSRPPPTSVSMSAIGGNCDMVGGGQTDAHDPFRTSSIRHIFGRSDTKGSLRRRKLGGRRSHGGPCLAMKPGHIGRGRGRAASGRMGTGREAHAKGRRAFAKCPTVGN